MRAYGVAMDFEIYYERTELSKPAPTVFAAYIQRELALLTRTTNLRIKFLVLQETAYMSLSLLLLGECVSYAGLIWTRAAMASSKPCDPKALVV